MIPELLKKNASEGVTVMGAPYKHVQGLPVDKSAWPDPPDPASIWVRE